MTGNSIAMSLHCSIFITVGSNLDLLFCNIHINKKQKVLLIEHFMSTINLGTTNFCVFYFFSLLSESFFRPSTSWCVPKLHTTAWTKQAFMMQVNLTSSTIFFTKKVIAFTKKSLGINSFTYVSTCH
jgi:hypothetical protein